MHRALIALCLLFVLTSAHAEKYYVRPDGNDSNSGLGNTPAGAWLTIQKAANTIEAGDTVFVQGGTYNERIAINISGSDGNWINFVGATNAVCRGFDLTDSSYVRIIGFEITHTTTTWARGITLNGTCSHIDLLDTYIHNTAGAGAVIRSGTDARTSYITVRGVRIFYPSFIEGVTTNVSNIAVGNFPRLSDHWLVEYNDFERCADFLVLFGTNIIARNNWLRDYNDTYWGAATHSDGIQVGSDGQQVGTRHQLYEANIIGQQTGADAHFGLWQDTVSAGDTNILIRGNIGYRNATGGIGVIGTKKVNTYNNTFWQLGTGSVPGAVWIFYSQPCSGMIVNSIISDDGSGTDAIYIESGYDVFASHNLGHLAGSEASYISTADPQFTDPTNLVFTLQAGSPAINAGTNLVWITSNDGSGTSFDVNDGQLLNDGWGMSAGDIVTIGATTTRITSIDSHTITVATAVTWTNLQPVFWNYDTTPDLGALPADRTNLVSASYSGGTVTTVGDARKVIWTRDGIPVHTDYDAPYVYDGYQEGDVAKAYPLYASTNLWVLATPAGGSGETPGTPANPQRLRARYR